MEKKIVSDKLPCALQSRGLVSHFDLTQWRVYFSLLSPQHSVCGIKWYTTLNQLSTSQLSSIILYCSFYLCIRIFFPVFSPFLLFSPSQISRPSVPLPSGPPSNTKAFVTVFWQRISWARLHFNFWTLFTRFFYTARSRNRPGSHEIMGIYGSNSRGVKKDRDLVTQPSSFRETLAQQPRSRGWNTGCTGWLFL